MNNTNNGQDARGECEYPDVKSTTGYRYGCRCSRCVEANREASRKYMRKWYWDNLEAAREKGRKWVRENRESDRESTRKWKQENPDKHNAQRARRRARKLTQLHPGADQEAIKALYAEAQRQEAITGEPHHVDHIIPLSKGGWHHEYNLQVLPGRLNCSKGDSMPGPHLTMAIQAALTVIEHKLDEAAQLVA